MNEDEDEDVLAPKEPQVTSENLEERKAARILRIQKREDFLKKESGEAGDTGIGGMSVSAGVVGGPVERQVAESSARLERLLAEGGERVTNVRVAADAREQARRQLQSDKRLEILEKLEAEATLAQEKFSQISDHWSPIFSIKDPLDIQSEINDQKERCEDLIAQKNNIIEDLKSELKLADDTFYKDLQKQLDDVKELGERIDAQVILMKNAYETQLGLIESSIQVERALTVQHNQKRWQALYSQRDQDEVDNIENKFAKIAEFEEKMDILTTEHREKYRAAKIQLEYEVQTLETELQLLKSRCLINSEKIDYNYQILKRREEENIFVRSQQKRRLNKMQDIINILKKKIKKAQTDGAAEAERAAREICRLHSAMLDLRAKSDHFSFVNNRRYQQVWLMNKERANKLLKQIQATDEIIHRDVLGLIWICPEIQLLRQIDLPSYKSFLVMQDNKLQESKGKDRKVENKKIDEVIKPNTRLVKHVLSLLADRSGFLIEERLWPLLEKYEQIPVTVCKLDNIFNALEIDNIEEIQLLCTYFTAYVYCSVCEDMEDNMRADLSLEELPMSAHTSKEQEGGAGDKSEITAVAKEKLQISNVGGYKMKLVKSDQMLLDEAGIIIKRCTSYTGGTMTAETTERREAHSWECEQGHPVQLSAAHALTALRDFLASQQNQLSDTVTARDTGYASVSRYLKAEEVEEFWKRYEMIFPPSKEKLWDGILHGLKEYLPILQERQKLNEEVVQLRKQNLELQHLLRGQAPADLPKTKYLTPLSKP